ncbi:uncharacterized protein LOC134239325 [Saccostrea cucullata]|uniref:uncharacterized protein LOC134239325 n=1 Tax=Saccostrea cuccullata TaxID=36930 RepID=UPI002ED11DC3
MHDETFTCSFELHFNFFTLNRERESFTIKSLPMINVMKHSHFPLNFFFFIQNREGFPIRSLSMMNIVSIIVIDETFILSFELLFLHIKQRDFSHHLYMMNIIYYKRAKKTECTEVRGNQYCQIYVKLKAKNTSIKCDGKLCNKENFDVQIHEHPTDDGEGSATLYQNLKEIIIHKTGSRPVDAQHVYDLDKHIDEFPHPPPWDINHDSTGTLLWTEPELSTFIHGLAGWDDIHEEDVSHYMNVFKHYPQTDVRLMYKHIIKEIGRRPTVQELGCLLPVLEGNEVCDSSRKTPGQLLLAMEECKSKLQQQKSINNVLKRELQLMQSRNNVLQSNLSSVHNGMKALEAKNRKLMMGLFVMVGFVCLMVFGLILAL